MIVSKTLKNVAFSVILVFFSLTSFGSDDEVPTEKIQQFVDVYKKIKDQYVDEVDDTTLFNYAIEGMVSNLDPYSDYLTKDDFSELIIGTTGRFGGIGIEITMEDGFVKIIADKKSDEILGVHIIGARAADLIVEGVTAMEFRASCEDISIMSHPHPTYSEALKEAALDALENRPLHI